MPSRVLTPLRCRGRRPLLPGGQLLRLRDGGALRGEERPEPCGHCDSCDAGTSLDVDDDAPLRAGERVEHTQWGPGTVSVVVAERVTVLFEVRGYVTLDTTIALDAGLLTPVADR